MSYHPRTHGPSFNGMRSLRFNDFLQTVARIAWSVGENPNHIVPMFKSLSSAHFLCGPPISLTDQQMRAIPQSVWQRVCTHYHAAAQGPYFRHCTDNKSVSFKQRSDVFISSKTTEQFVRSSFLMEQFDSARRLYQYLNWTLRISKVAQTVAMFQGRNGGRLLVINVELHDRSGNELYALCPPNDVTTHRAQNWQLAALLSAPELVALLGIHGQSLPRGVRAVSSQYALYRELMADPNPEARVQNMRYLKERICGIDARRKPVRYSHLKCIQTGNGNPRRKDVEDDVMTIGLSRFYAKVRTALSDDQIPLIPIVSIVSRTTKIKDRREKHEDFSVDYLLPVPVEDVWVGVVYRDEECSMALLDRYDISNKAILCDPTFNTRSLEWFQNGFNRLRVFQDEISDADTNSDTVSMRSGAHSDGGSPLLTPSVTPTLSTSFSYGSSAGSMGGSVVSDHGDLYLAPSPVTPICEMNTALFIAPKVTVSGGVTAELKKQWDSDRVIFEQFLNQNKQFLSRLGRV